MSDGLRTGESDENTNRTADQAHDNALDEELRQDIAAPGADRHPDADFARSFRYRHEHDVHDSDASHQQRDAGDCGQEKGHHFSRTLRRVGKVRLIPDREIVLVVLRDLV